MEEIKTVSNKQKQQAYLDVVQTIIGVQFWIPEECVQTIFPKQDGGTLFVYNASIIGIPNCFQKFEVHENKFGKLLVQFVNNKLDKPVLWYKHYVNIDDFKNQIIDLKEHLFALKTV